MRFESLPHQDQMRLLAETAQAATRLWDLPGTATVTLINLSENATYRVAAPGGGLWALRLHRDGYHSEPAIRSELLWLQALRKEGVVVTPVPLPGRDGDLLQRATHPALERPRFAVVSAWEAGGEPGIGQDLTGPFESLGEVAARMHLHAQQFARPPWFTRPVWDFEAALGESAPLWGRWRDGLGMDAAKSALFARTVARIGTRLAAYGQGPGRFGLIHCDLRLANLLIDGDQVKVIDFDDCGFSWFMYDAATPVSFYEDDPKVPELIAAWVRGYRRVRALSAADEAEIPTFLMLRRLLLVAWVGSHSQTDLARSLGAAYTDGTVALCKAYLTATA